MRISRVRAWYAPLLLLLRGSVISEKASENIRRRKSMAAAA
jgi:hypothetical protein